MRKYFNIIAAYSIMLFLIIMVGIFQSWSIALSILNYCLISAVMTMGANIQWGYAGLINFGIMGYTALGGLAVGETQHEMFKVLDDIKKHLPIEKPQYLMGVGTPSDILGAVKRGIDMFDCVLPTRSGRTGLAFTWHGRINIKNNKYQNDNTPLDQYCENLNLNKYSKNYLNHLFNTNEILASMLLTLNNINFYQELMASIRKNINEGTFDQFHDKYIDKL